MKSTRRNFIKTATLLSAALTTRAYSKDTLTLWGPPVAPTVLLAIAAEMGQARKITPFQVRTWMNPDQLRAGLLNGSIQMSIVPCYVAANLRAQGQNVILHNIMTKGLLYIMAKQSVHELSALQNQKIILPFRGDMPDIVLQILTQAHNITPAQIEYSASAPETVTRFLQQDFPFAILPEPMASAALLRGRQNAIEITRALSLHEEWDKTFMRQNGMVQAGLLVQESTYQEQSAFLEALDQDLKNAITWLEANPASAAEIASQYLPVPAPALQESLQHSSLTAEKSQDIADDILFFLDKLYDFNPKILGGKKADPSLFGVR